MGKFAILISANTDDAHTATCANGIEYGIDLDENGHEVDIYFDGAATKWIRKLESDNDHVVYKYYSQARENGLIAGACFHCASAYGAKDAIQETDIPLLGEGNNFDHGPHAGDLVDDGYELITIG